MKCIPDIMAPWVFISGDDDYPMKHDFHWYRYHADHEDWLSLHVNRKGDTWEVRLYPDPEYDGANTRTVHDSREEAVQRVVEIMEKHD